VSIAVPGLKTVSEQNLREHWRSRNARTEHQKHIVGLCMNTAGAAVKKLKLPLIVQITRISPGPGLDSDNLVASQKHVRDAIAKVLKVDDKDARVDWRVDQKKGPWGVEILITENLG